MGQHYLTKSQGKIDVPEFLSIPLQELINSLSTIGVVGMRKLLQDLMKANTPLFVVSIFGPKLPQILKVNTMQH